MPPSLQKAWTELVLPLLRRPERMQVSALCHRRDASGKTEILLITSRGTGRWILPKGWPIDGLSGARFRLFQGAGRRTARALPGLCLPDPGAADG